ncbi:MAG TPA: hypothetical protein VFS00_20135 [Polyangiaceae bacterium]|nr:hypothetical protein [Polyangiaceae bacterium]
MATDSRRPAPARPVSDAALRAYFVAARPDLDAPAELGAVLRATIEAARAAWSEAAQPDERFVHFVAAKLPEGVPVDAALGALHTADLYLACACAHGDARALARFERLCTAVTVRAAGRLGASAEQRDELSRRMLDLLLTPRGPGPGGPGAPRIHDFSGRGTLEAWTKVIAVRETVAFLRHQRHEREAQDQALALGLEHDLEPDDGPEVAYFKRLYREEFKIAFHEAVAALSERERTILRQYFLEGLSIDRLAAHYQVHRATAARWVEAAREAVSRRTHRALSRRLRVPPDELDSLMRLIHSQLDLSLSSLLRQGDAPTGAAPANAPGEREG